MMLQMRNDDCDDDDKDDDKDDHDDENDDFARCAIANCPFHGHSYLFTSRITTMICWDHLGHDDYHEHLIIIIDLLLMI